MSKPKLTKSFRAEEEEELNYKIPDKHNVQSEHNYVILSSVIQLGGPGSSVGIATELRAVDGPGSNPGGDDIFRPSRPALGPTQPPVKWVPGLSRG